MSNLSTFLFVNPSFTEGLARTLDIGCTFDEYNHSQTGQQADFIALRADWRAIGQDIQKTGLEECQRLLDQETDNGQSARGR
jgi:hypothetical protein